MTFTYFLRAFVKFVYFIRPPFPPIIPARNLLTLFGLFENDVFTKA